MAKRSDPFSVKLSQADEQALTARLCDELQYALSARSSIIDEGGDLDYWDWLYSQGPRPKGTAPWPGAADLTSYIPTEKIDALRARMVKTIMVEPIWIVEGWGPSASRAPIVEEFHQWKAEEERLQGYLGKWFHNGLVHGTGILECSEKAEKRISTKQIRAALTRAEDGSVLLNDKGEPTPEYDEDGRIREPSDPSEPSADMIVRDPQVVRLGPSYRIISARDFLMLPGHAQDRADVWGYCKRFWRRMPELQAREKAGLYRNVKDLSTVDERSSTTARGVPEGQQIATQDGASAEKELWELLVLLDLDQDGVEEWYVVTLSLTHRVLLRVQHDDLGLSRYMLATPFPRPNSVWGYSFTQKLASIAEEHTAIRNMAADRSALATNAPMKRVQGALWDPQEQPWGPRQVIDVRDLREVEMMVVQDVPASVFAREQGCIAAGERMSGLNDVAAGATPGESRTLGEIQLVTEQSFVRMEESLRYQQEVLEDLFLTRHELWLRALESDPAGASRMVPASVTQNLALRGQQLDGGGFTADTLRGTFRGKPRGSVETADKARQRADFNALLNVLGGLAKMFPPLMQILMRPEAVRSLLEEALRVHNVRDRQAFLPPPQEMAQLMAPPMPGLGAPGMPLPPGAQPPMGAGPGGPGMPPQGLPPQLLQMLMAAMQQQGGQPS